MSENQISDNERLALLEKVIELMKSNRISQVKLGDIEVVMNEHADSKPNPEPIESKLTIEEELEATAKQEEEDLFYST